jgi:hypothetical protein
MSSFKDGDEGDGGDGWRAYLWHRADYGEVHKYLLFQIVQPKLASAFTPVHGLMNRKPIW